MKRFAYFMFIFAFSLLSLIGCGKTDSRVDESDNAAASDVHLLKGKHDVEISVKDYGVIAVELDADVAPITVTNFVNLAEQGFYNGLTFHRIIDNFMIQGGDPNGNGSGGAPTGNIRGEFEKNGIDNNIPHSRGVISMARSDDMDSASSQFFIMQADTPSLDGQYAAFGRVTEGIEVVDQICEKTAVQDRNGTVLPEDQPIIESVQVIS